MPPLDAAQLQAHIKALADEAAAAATATVKVDFGTGVQPQNRVLNAWQTLNFPWKTDAAGAPHPDRWAATRESGAREGVFHGGRAPRRAVQVELDGDL